MTARGKWSALSIVLASLLVISSGCTDENTFPKPYVEKESDVFEYEKFSGERHSSSLSSRVAKERNFSGFTNMSIEGYRFKVYADVGGPVYAEVSRVFNASSALKVGDVIVFYTGIASQITKTPNAEMLRVHWSDVNLGRIEEVRKERVLVKYIKGGILFEKVGNNTFRATPKQPGSLVWIPKDKVLNVIENEN